MLSELYFQDQVKNVHCFGCGADNKKGLQIKSRWNGDEAVCVWHPKPEHMAGPKHILNGGIIGTIMDCHGIWTAIAHAYREEDREISSPPMIWYVTGSLKVNYLKPTPIDVPVELRSHVQSIRGKITIVHCALSSDGVITAKGEVLAVKVPAELWYKGHQMDGGN